MGKTLEKIEMAHCKRENAKYQQQELISGGISNKWIRSHSHYLGQSKSLETKT